MAALHKNSNNLFPKGFSEPSFPSLVVRLQVAYSRMISSTCGEILTHLLGINTGAHLLWNFPKPIILCFGPLLNELFEQFRAQQSFFGGRVRKGRFDFFLAQRNQTPAQGFDPTRPLFFQLVSGIVLQKALDAAEHPLNLAVPALEPVGGPYPVDLPAQVFEDFLPEAITVARRAARVIARPVAFDAEQERAGFGRMLDAEVDEKARHAHLREQSRSRFP